MVEIVQIRSDIAVADFVDAWEMNTVENICLSVPEVCGKL